MSHLRLSGPSATTDTWRDLMLALGDAYTTLPAQPGGLLAAKIGADHRFYAPDMQGHVRQVTDLDSAPGSGAGGRA